MMENMAPQHGIYLMHISSFLMLVFANIVIVEAIVDEGAQPWIYNLPENYGSAVCNGPLYMGVAQNTPLVHMNDRDAEDFQKYLFSSIQLTSPDVRFVFGNFSKLLYFNQSGDTVFGYPSSRHRPMRSMADLLYAMREYVFPKRVHPQIAKILLVVTDIISQNITGMLQEASLLRSRGVMLVCTGVRKSVGDFTLLRKITNNEELVFIYPTFTELYQNLRSMLLKVCSIASTVARAFELHVSPNFGPESGGTALTIVGHPLSTMKVKKVRVGPLNCKIDRDKSEYINLVCITSSAKGTSVRLNQPLNLTVYGSKKSEVVKEYSFKYKADPVIDEINPRRTILSGGVLLTVSGRHIDSVAKPLLLVYMEFRRRFKQSFTSEVCSITGTSNMECPTPKLKLPPEVSAQLTTTTSATNNANTEPPPKSAIDNPDLNFYLGLVMDGMVRYRNLSNSLPTQSGLEVYIDPHIEFFEHSPIALKPGLSYIDIKGSKLTLGLTIRDFTVKVGDAICELVDLNYNRLTFRPPRRSPKGYPEHDGSYRVQVLVGVGYLTFTPGNVTYAKDLKTYIVIGCIIVLLLILAAIIVVWYVKKWRNKPCQENLDRKPAQNLNKKDEKLKDKSKQIKTKGDKPKQESVEHKVLPQNSDKPPNLDKPPPLPKRPLLPPSARNGSGPRKANLYNVIPPRTK